MFHEMTGVANRLHHCRSVQADDETPLAFSFGCLGAGVLMLFVATTFYKGLKTTPCLLNISFLVSQQRASVQQRSSF